MLCSRLPRKQTRMIQVGNVPIGGNQPISVQSMTNTFTHDVPSTVHQINQLTDMGCELVRVAVPDMPAASAISEIKKQISIPLIADIHFDYRLAIASIESGADAIRINPGNIGHKDKVQSVVLCAKDHHIPIRIGVNSGSLEKEILNKYQRVTSEAMVESALKSIDLVNSFDFDQIKISLKASDVYYTIDAYRLLSSKVDFPLHVGITAAGPLYTGIVKSVLGIGTLLSEGIGDTIRVSLTADPVEEVKVGFELLKALGLREHGPNIISCPTCGRCKINLFQLVDEVEKSLKSETKPITIAIMGCVVNGPGEAREADVGIAGGDGFGILFRKGQVIQKCKQDQLVPMLLEEINHITL
ncbi:MAG: flavodoxin-dependent (E)-4-hydroxy-3-methylbut-2-enyl-diphosphate synthase [Desulfobacterales bacterium]|nr:flavodoxin-dependent (E)-4-hydroxy-3-methylbut-2-enyl-diphosphate synthase [Desulfobacterales bacterium]